MLLAVLAIISMMLPASSIGRSALDRVIGRQEAEALLPGVTVESVARPGRGLIVTSLRSDSQAAAAGIAVGDAIAAIDGHPVETLDRTRAYLHNDATGRIELQLIHAHRRRSILLARNGDVRHGP